MCAHVRAEQVHDNVINDVINEQMRAGSVQGGSVDDWLEDIKMSRYRDNFARCGYTRVDQLKHLSRRELTTTLGITLVGHQKKILDSVEVLRTAVAAASTEVDVPRTLPRSFDPLLA